MDTRTGEIMSAEEMERRIKAMPEAERRRERQHFRELTPFEKETLEKLSPAERIAFKVRRKTNPDAAYEMLAPDYEQRKLEKLARIVSR